MNMKKSVGVSSAAVLLALGVGLNLAFAQGGPVRVSGGGEATAAAFVTYVRTGLPNLNVPSINTVGNRITFGFNATKRANGDVAGQMQLVDHTEGLVIHSDVVNLTVPHPVLINPVGSTGVSARINAGPGTPSDTGVVINGVPQPGWRLANSPLFDGGEGANGTGDTICFELFSAAAPGGPPVRQWSAFLSSGNVQIVD